MASFPLQTQFRGPGENETHATRRSGKSSVKRCQTHQSGNLSRSDINHLTDDEVAGLFRKLRWPETDGEPVCPKCGALEGLNWMRNQKRWKCRGCRYQFTVTSRSIFAYHKMSLREILMAVHSFVINAKGCTAIALSEELGCEYKTAFVMLHKLREAQMISNQDIKPEGEIKMTIRYGMTGPYRAHYANDAIWRESNQSKDDRTRVELTLSCALRAPQSQSFGGYWQHNEAKKADPPKHPFEAVA